VKQQIFLNQSSRKCFLLIALLLMSATSVVLAQTAVFTFQGKLSDGGNPANSNYDLQFKLYDALTGGAQIGVRTRTDVQVAGGNFTVQLDFAVGAFSGADRFLEIGVRAAGSPDPFTTLSPRQPITSSPYAFHSLSSDLADAATTATNANQLGGVVANQYVLTTDTRMTDSRPPLSGSPNYIQNSTSQQAASNFYISGNGTLGGTLSTFGAINTFGQYNIANNRVLSIEGTNNTFAGLNAGANSNAGATDNSFFGRNAGQHTMSILFDGNLNSFFGSQSGQANTSGFGNSFFGQNSGLSNTAGYNNSFFGVGAGRSQSGLMCCNSFFGALAGETNTNGEGNSFFGIRAGEFNTSGSDNSFFGGIAGRYNTTGGNNSFFGSGAGDTNDTGSDNTFVGEEAGRNSNGCCNTFIGTSAGISNATGANNTILGAGADVGSGNLDHATAIGVGAVVSTSNTIALGRSDGSDFVRIPGFLTIPNLAATGIKHLCVNSNDRVADCSSSLRYKTNLAPYLGGLSIINRLRPISFTWKEGGMHDLGLGAEDVEKIDPLLVTYNKQAQVEGVKYDRLNVVLVNAINEQQQQIAAQQKEIRELRSIEAANAQLKTQLAAIAVRLVRVERRRVKRR